MNRFEGMALSGPSNGKMIISNTRTYTVPIRVPMDMKITVDASVMDARQTVYKTVTYVHRLGIKTLRGQTLNFFVPENMTLDEAMTKHREEMK